MSDSYLIVLGAGPHQTPVYQTASLLGLKTLAVDYNPKAVAIQYADEFLCASVNNKNKEECIEKLKKTGFKYRGVVASGIEVSPLASAIAKEFNLTWVSESVAHNTTNKCARSTVLQNAGIPIPKFEIINDSSFPKINLPFVVKPSDNSGSRGVRVVDSKKDWFDAYNDARSLSGDGKVIVEELLYGNEISIEGFVLNGKVIIHGFSDRNYIPDYYPYFMEDGSTSPTHLSSKVVAEAKKIFSEAVLMLGIVSGPSKGDLIVTKNGIKVLEITSRLSPLFPMIVPHSTGVDPLQAVIRWACGMDIPRSILEPKFEKAWAHRYFFHKPGKIKKITGFYSVQEQPGVKVAVFLQHLAMGDILAPSSYINRPLHIATIANNRASAVKLAESALQTVCIEIE